MRNVVLVMVLLVGTLIAPTTVGATEGEGHETGVIWGTVLDSESQHPLSDICVEVFDGGEQTDYWGYTNAEGVYEIPGVEPGSYVLEFTDCEFQVFDGTEAAASVTAGAETGVHVALDLGDGYGVVTGTVTDGTHQEPLGGVCVKLYEAGDDIFVTYRVTLENGTYQLYAEAGDYRVRFKACDGDGLVEQWWAGAEGWEGSTAISVTAGAYTSGIDAAMEVNLEADGVVWGYVIDGETGEGVHYYCVSVYEGDDKIKTVVTGEHGGYEIALDPGEYRIKAWACETEIDLGTVWYLAGADFESADVVGVPAGGEVELEMILVGDVRFRDAVDNHFHDDIVWLAEEGITLGCNGDGTEFCPEDKVTRAQMAAFLHRALAHLLEASGEPISFDDVADGSTFEDDIAWLASVGITLGCDAEGHKFCPDEEVSRGQMAAFLYRALHDILEGDGVGAEFGDDDGSTFEDEIEWLASVGVTSGCDAEGTAFCPDDAVIRSHMAAFLHRALGTLDA